jgi:hypothetical protein
MKKKGMEKNWRRTGYKGERGERKRGGRGRERGRERER